MRNFGSLFRLLRSSSRNSHMCHISLSSFKHDFSNNSRNFNKNFAAISFIGSAYILYTAFDREASAEASMKIEQENIYRQSEISKHNSKENGIWITYEGCVYDITAFVDQHPGGKKILLAAGGDLGPFWALYAVHNNPEVKAMLQEFKIGLVAPEDVSRVVAEKEADPFINDPSRHPVLKVASSKPFNAEPPGSLLVDSFNTPNDLFYVRNHMPVPVVDLKDYKLEIVSANDRKSINLDEIKNLPKVTINATVQCAGNRRSEMSKVKSVKGLNWNHGALGNADWTGVRLVDVLSYCGIAPAADVKHVHFEGLDVGADKVPYAASIPADTALDPRHDVIIAYEMNGQPLSRDHGAPLRVIVPGVVGARNVKWVAKVVLSDRESDSHWQQGDYKGLPPSADWDNVDFSKAPAIQELPVISAICVPEEGETVEVVDGTVSVKGYAWSGGGRRIVRVDVTGDKGQSWHTADLQQGDAEAPRHWGWTLFSIDVPIKEESGSSVEIWAKAVDSSYNTQPESFDHIWNLRGVLSNAYHKIKIILN